MAGSRGKGKRTFISLSSSSEEEDELETEEEEEEEDDDDDDDYENNSFSSSSGDETEEEGEEEEEGNESDDNDRTENDETLCNRVIALLKEGGELESLSLRQCKAYLRNHGLRITGTKAVCQQRILEHWKIKDGNAEALYPRSSFFINCTGDVCKGDIVLFEQKVYEKFNKLTRQGRPLGRRTVAGKVVKESYGKAKQQHTFTVEVLWCKGIKKLPSLFPLLVKGRNLYKLKTYRQRWSDEAERRNVLAEKHRRGKAARLVKAMKKSNKKWTKDAGTKQQKHLHHSQPLKKRKATEQEKGKIVNAQGKASIPRRANMSKNYQATSLVGQVKKKQNSRLRVSKSSYSHRKPVSFTENKGATCHSYGGPVPNPYRSQTKCQHRNATKCQHRNAPLHFASYDMGSTSTMVRSLPFRPYVDEWTVPASQYQGFNFNNHSYTHHANSNPRFCHK
ncbi:zinc finger CCCH domain-containing protein 62 isoform X2 [Herrania umbratica]|uniref:Zinc finger CCCH domain-containing protein 62 isoform X2 n=1 Tax=Herrania umbratica TaxID=108875 RepID=A0A6J1BNV5_9ROSI|nr:zinc finger CCCH domain-containing protein 62 isoform X2 [Herrania umbratica]